MGFASGRTDEILSKYENPKQLYEDRANADKILNTWTKRDCSRLSSVPLSVANGVIDDCDRCGIKIITPDMDEYPKTLFDIYGTPLVFYAIGDVSLLKTPIAATVVGTREPTKYATRAAYKLSFDLAKAGVTIVSGSALGIDSWAHGGALDAGGKTIAVAGTGLDIDYPKPNHDLRARIAREGLVISEFPPRTKPDRNNFPYRNRIMSALSCGTIVAQAPHGSGSLITARTAIEQGKDVYIVPDSIFCEASAGGLDLLKECGYPITSAIDFINNYIAEYGEYLVLSEIPTKAVYTPSKEVQQLEESSETPAKVVATEEEKPEPLNTDIPDDMDEVPLGVYNLLRNDTLTPDVIARILNIPVGLILTTLSDLEMDNFIRSVGNNQYTAKQD